MLRELLIGAGVALTFVVDAGPLEEARELVEEELFPGGDPGWIAGPLLEDFGDPESTVRGVRLPRASLEFDQLFPGAGSPEAVQQIEQLDDLSEEELLQKSAELRAEHAEDGSAWGEAARLGSTPLERDTATAAYLTSSLEVVSGISSDPDIVASTFSDCSTRDSLQADGSRIRVWTEETHACEVLHERSDARRYRTVDVSARPRTVQQEEGTLTEDLVLTYEPIVDPDLTEDALYRDFDFEVTGDALSAQFDVFPDHLNDYYAEVRVVFDPDGPAEQEFGLVIRAERVSLSQEIIDEPEDLLSASDGFCNARFVCTDSDTRTIDGVSIQGAVIDQLDPLYPLDFVHGPPDSNSPFCWEARVEYECDFTLGTLGCWTTATGETECHANTEDNRSETTCPAVLAERRSLGETCSFVAEACQGNAEGHGDFCYVSSRTYRCRAYSDVQEISVERTTQCEGQALVETDKGTVVENYVQTQAALTFLNHALSDVEVDEFNPTGGATRMAGRPLECRKGTGSDLDCCSLTEFGANSRYVATYVASQRQGHALENAARSDAISARSAFQYSGSGLQALSNSLSTPHDSIAASPGLGSSEASPRVAYAMDRFRAEAVEDFVRTRSGYQCTVDELDLALQREAGACHHVGSYCDNGGQGGCVQTRAVYCCYNSPMSRMIHEATGDGAGADFNIEQVDALCGGLRGDVVSADVMQSVALGEWVGRLKEAGVVPSPSDPQFDLHRRTGAASSLNAGSGRKSATQRARDATDSLPRDQVVTIARQEMADRRQPEISESPAVADVRFAHSFVRVSGGYPEPINRALEVQRMGDTANTLTLSYATRPGRLSLPGFTYEHVEGSLSWPSGDSAPRFIEVPIYDDWGHVLVDLDGPLPFKQGRTAEMQVRREQVPPDVPDNSSPIAIRTTMDVEVVGSDVYLRAYIENVGFETVFLYQPYVLFYLPAGVSVTSLTGLGCDTSVRWSPWRQQSYAICTTASGDYHQPGDVVIEMTAVLSIETSDRPLTLECNGRVRTPPGEEDRFSYSETDGCLYVVD